MYQESKKYLAILPAILVILILFWGGLLYGLLQSFGLFNITGKSIFTLDVYKEVLGSDWFMVSLLFTIKIAVFSSFYSGIIALFVLFILFVFDQENEHKKRDFLKNIFTSPMSIPYLVSGYLITIILMRSGWISSIYYSLGLIKEITEFPVLTNEKKGISIIVTYVWKTAPFIVLMSYPALLRINKKWIEVAKVFGIKKSRFFIEIVLPLLLPSIITSIFIVFSYIFSAFEVPYLLGVTYPKSLAVLSYELYSKGNLEMRPHVMVINIVISLISFGIGIVVYFINEKYIIKKQRGWR